MQQAIQRRDVYEKSLTATVNGWSVELSSVTLDRELPDPLAGATLTSASGQIVAAEGSDVADTVATPWDPGTQWPPVPESPASVSMDTGAGPVSLLRVGRVTSAHGGTSSGDVTVELADQYQSLDRSISWDELAADMPSREEGGLARYVGLQGTAVTDLILRHCGWYSTPPMLGLSVLSVPAQGTLWPERGRVDSSLAPDGTTKNPGWLNTPWGVGAADMRTEYTLAGAGYTVKGEGRVEFVAMTYSTPSTCSIQLISDGDLLARLAWTESTGSLWVRAGNGEHVLAASVPRSAGLLYGTIEYVTDTSVRCIIRSGGEVITAIVPCSSWVTTRAARTGVLQIGERASGFQIAYPTQSGTLTSWQPNAVLYPRPADRNWLHVLPPMEGANCAELLAEQCEAECATYWIDETGVLRWWDLSRLERQTPVATLWADDDIEESGFTWSHDLSQVKSRVAVKWRSTLRDWSWRTRVDLWQGSGVTLQPDDNPTEQFISVPDDEIWIMPDTDIRALMTSAGDQFNYGFFSWFAAVVDDTDTWAQHTGTLRCTIERINGSAFKMVMSWVGTGKATMKTVSEDADSGLWKRRRDMDMPILRGKGKFTLTDMTTFSAQVGPASAPEHVIDAGWWIQRPEQAQYTANYAGARLTVPQPVLSSIELIPVPGLQLGDMVEVVDKQVTRLTVRGLVVSDSRAVDSDMSMSHTVAVRPVFVTRNGVTWEEWGSVMAARTWSSWGSKQAGKRWQDWAAAPLLGEDTVNG